MTSCLFDLVEFKKSYSLSIAGTEPYSTEPCGYEPCGTEPLWALNRPALNRPALNRAALNRPALNRSSTSAEQQQSQPPQSQSAMARKTRSTTNKKNDAPDTKRSPIMNGSRSKPISVGTSYQVFVLPECKGQNGDEEKEYEKCLWSANHEKLQDKQIDDFCKAAAEDYGIDLERALYILHNSDHNLHTANSAVTRRTVAKERFSADDAFAFRNAHMYFGKNFGKIRQVLSHKSLSALIEHYYLTKKQQNYKSAIDNDKIETNGVSDSDSEGQTQVRSELHRLICEVCHKEVLKLYTANGLELCRGCKLYFKATNKHRVCAQPVEEIKRIPICPPEMMNIAEQFAEMARTVHQFKDIADGSDELQIEHRNKTVCEQKIQEVSNAQKKLNQYAIHMEKEVADRKKRPDILEARKFVQNTATSGTNGQRRLVHSWLEPEKAAAMDALIRFNGDHKLVAEVLGTKTPDMVKAFYGGHAAEIQEAISERHKKVVDEHMKMETETKKCNDMAVQGEIIVLD
ncbi:hypothetical protein GPALN_012590 [Globodera pallida]|nr:hypothetical protein GPALN_012590 [Globodera pallida]